MRRITAFFFWAAIFAGLAGMAFAQDAPTALSVQPTLNGITEGTPVGNGIKTANLGVRYADDAKDPLSVTYALSGQDATSFEVRNGTELWFIAGTPDYESKSVYDMTITANYDGGTVQAGYKLPVFDVREATLAYRYDPDSKLYMGGAEKVPTGKDGELLVGKNTTLVKPPVPAEGNWPEWNDKTESWDEVELFVGRDIWNTASKDKRQVEYAKDGNAIPDGWTDQEPPAGEFYEWDAATSAWVENTVKKDEAAALISRVTALKQDDDTRTLATRLENATPQQIETFVNNKVTDLASARKAFIEILKLMASERQKGAEDN